MWREFIESFGLACSFGEPATREELAELETAVGSHLPPDLHGLLTEANGVTFKPRFAGERGASELAMEEEWVFDLVWSTSEIAEQNYVFRSWNNAATPPPDLIFFGCLANGDPAALHQDTRGDRPSEVVVMSHEDWGRRRVVSPSLREYLTIFLQASQ